MINATYVSYEEAQKLIPLFEYYAQKGQWKEVRQDAKAILEELRFVRSIDYSPLPGNQVVLTSDQYKFLDEVRGEVGR